MQTFVRMPRFILSVQEPNAMLMADSDEGAAMTKVTFQDHVHDVSATGGVAREMPSWSGTLSGTL
jgi:hypothetical protein